MGTEITPLPKIRQSFYTTYALLPTTGVNEGDIGYATDTLRLYRWNGAAWQPITPNPNLNLQGIKVLKTADETVNNSSTLQDDDHLLFAVGANEIWTFELLLRITMSEVAATTGIKYDFTIPAAGALKSFYLSAIGPNIGNSTLLPVSSGTPVQTAQPAITTEYWVLIKGLYIGGANAGNVQLQWAQVVAFASNSKVLANSFIIAYKLN